MLAEWKTFLLSEGAHIDNDIVRNFGDPQHETMAALTENVIVDLSYLAVIKITGTDAATFLNNQFTSDITQLSNGHVQLSAWCNPKGQVIANFIIINLADDYFILLSHALKDRFIKRLQMFVLRAVVTIEDCYDSLQCIGFKSTDIEQIEGIEITDLQTKSKHAFRQDEQILFSLPVNQKRKIIFGPVDSLRHVWLKLSKICTRIGSQYWQLYDVLDGLPWIQSNTSETYLPQLLNLDHLHGLSFDKGCFPGQEVIARLHYRGKYKRRLFIANIDTESTINSGAKIYMDSIEKSVGTILNIAPHPTKGQYALAILNVEHAISKHLHLGESNDPFLKISTPAYISSDGLIL